ncbi:hypothetical protein BSL78_26547 [Apostichopus japonicus]|uniref:Shugoshin C-terminal domain-containing protein n=1 Tax=Stichopus japonicus TaxID=307972 RepID=A0A2G8JLK2_STIJA|nr:hypothetical protein BSL78_26547 [Apostichopus japonicus]
MRHHSGSEQGTVKIKSEKRNIQVKQNLTGKDNFGSEMGQEREVEVDGTRSQKEEASGSSDDSKERADERKMDEKETIGNKKQGQALGKKSLQTSHRKSQVTFKDDIERIEKENMCAIDESGDGKPSIPADEPTHEEEVPEETGRRPSRQARTKAAKNLKEPSLGKKLRRGDPFTDTKLLTSPLVKCKKGKKPGKVTSQDSMARTALGDATNVT